MAADKNLLSFGSYLKTSRIEKGVNLKEVSRETRVSEETLLLIEMEDHERLPAEVFVKGFLRAYAKAVGADGDVAVRRYLSNRQAIMETSRLDSELNESSTSVLPRIAISLGALFCVIALSVFGVSFFQGWHGDGDSAKYETKNKKRNGVSLRHTRESVDAESQSGAFAQKMLLRIIAIENTQIVVTIDDHNPKTFDLNPSDRIELEASSGFNLDIGNAGGVRLILNEKALPTPGKSGQAVTIRIP
ncbi:MAG: RodZ domain-containing protein [Pseudomonadota bacterium]